MSIMIGVECQTHRKEMETYLRQIEYITDRLHIDLSCLDTVSRFILDHSVYTENIFDTTKVQDRKYKKLYLNNYMEGSGSATIK